ncbi:hypothetical protein [Nonomuraea rhizosphaerae]|uniref:hypothetical protein n=1 Tax=Nonomuraea rhizosphaerae TaxID=2665663 RepID=UPI001C60440C|nr:hypothetical protein [Nonomuraea rhizosphaerae]
MRTQAGDDLIERIRAHSSDGAVVGPAANDLLSELFAGYPVENLARLLRSGDDAAVRTGAWLLSELGDLAAPMLGEVPALLVHPLPQVRFFAIDVVPSGGDARHGPAVARVLSLSADPEPGVRWKVLGYLADATAGQLAAGASYLEEGRVKELTTWLARLEDDGPDPREVLARLDDPDPTTRLFAAAAAARLYDEDGSLLEHAATLEDEEIRSFAQAGLDR